MAKRALAAVVSIACIAVAAFSVPPVAAATLSGSWSALGSGAPGGDLLNASVNDFAMFQSDLYVAGAFEALGGDPNGNHIARWNGTSWSTVGTSNDGGSVFEAPLTALAVMGGYLYAAGSFKDAAGIPEADYLAKWDGSSWSAVGSNPSGDDGAIPTTVWNQVQTLEVDGTDLYVGGGFDNVYGLAAADNIVRWDGSEWSAIGSDDSGDGAISNGVNAIVVTPDGIFAAGAFRDANDNPLADHVVFWNGSDWLALGSNGQGGGALSDTANALVMIGSDLYAGGNFLNIYGSSDFTNYISRWDGTSWHGVGAVGSEEEDFNGPVFDLAALNGTLIAGGNFNARADYIAQLEGSTWSTLGPDGAMDYPVFALFVSGGDVYAGGRFINVAGIPEADHVAVYRTASAMHKPDGRIRKGTQEFVGNNIYNDDGSSQTVAAAKARGKTVTFGVSVQNDGNVKARFRIHATGPSTTMYSVRYFRGSTDITNAVENGTYQTSRLARGSAFLIQAKVKVKSNATVGSSIARMLTIRPVSAVPSIDVVKFEASRN